MVSIYVGEEDKTNQITDWRIRWNEQQETLDLKYCSNSKKPDIHPLSDCRIVPTRELGESLLKRRGSSIVQPIERGTVYGGTLLVGRATGPHE